MKNGKARPTRTRALPDGRTHLADKAEHAVDLESTAIVAAHVTTAERGDTVIGEETLLLGPGASGPQREPN